MIFSFDKHIHAEHSESPLPAVGVRKPQALIVGATLSICLLLAAQTTAYTQSISPTSVPNHKETAIMKHAKGSFEVKVVPQKPDNTPAEEANLGRMSLDKQFHGELEGTSKGEMLSAMTEVKGSACYVAIERVTATLGGRSGSFVLYHNGLMVRGTPELSVKVLPDSGTGALTGITGTMNIIIEGKNHFYEFDYSLPE